MADAVQANTDRSSSTGEIRFFMRYLISIGCCLLLAIAGCRPKSESAIEIPTDSSSTKPNFHPEVIAKHNRGVGLMGKYNFDQARDVFDQLHQQHPEWQDFVVDLAIATLNRQSPTDEETAAALLDEVLQQNPDHIRAMFCRAVLYMNSGHSDLALPLFQRVVTQDADDAYAKYFTGQCLLDLGQAKSALNAFLDAVAKDPYLRSGYYGAFNAARQLGNNEQATKYLQDFQKLDGNPQARLAEIKYTRMGPNAIVRTLSTEKPKPSSEPVTGSLFGDPIPLRVTNESIRWWTGEAPKATSTICDIDQDGRLDVFIANGISVQNRRHNAVLLAQGDTFVLQPDHPLAAITETRAVLWGDIDNDGLTDAYFCRRGENELWLQTQSQVWKNVTSDAGVAGGPADTVDGALVDADHDGDLDLFLVNRDTDNELLSNNLDGTFRSLGQTQGIAGDGRPSRQVVFTDLDNDRDVDLIVINDTPPHEIYLNDRLWQYHKAEGFDKFCETPIGACIAADRDVDGNVELYTVTENEILAWTGGESWTATRIGSEMDIDVQTAWLAVTDLNGTGDHDLLLRTRDGWVALLDDLRVETMIPQEQEIQNLVVTQFSDARGPSVLGLRKGDTPIFLPPGTGRYPYLRMSFVGGDDTGQQMRSNASGIGVRGAVRAGTNWSSFTTLRTESGPGQSLQPVSVGMHGADQCDFVRIDWPDGLLQTESDLQTGKPHRIVETQRQTSSCPVLFAWNGTDFQFITDLLGVGGLGFNLGAGEYAAPRPWENVLLPQDLIKRRDGVYELRIGEPMEETCYLDAVRLVQYDLPAGWQMALDERSAVSEPLPTGNAIFFRQALAPTTAVNDRGQDVIKQIADVDGRAAETGVVDRRFLGFATPHTLTLSFDTPLDEVTPGTPVLLFNGWIEYPYSQTMFAAWQAGIPYDAPTLEARGEDGEWKTVLPQFGFMAGMPRQATVPLPIDKLPHKTTQLRLSTNLEIYWDRILVILAERCESVRITNLPLLRAEVREPGFAQRQTFTQRRPHYNYQRRAPLWDTRHATGFYTSFGDARELVNQIDDAVAVFGPGEEVQLTFEAPLTATDFPIRRFVLESNGWCKDMDLYTKASDTVGPLPTRDSTDASSQTHRERLHSQYNQRFRSR